MMGSCPLMRLDFSTFIYRKEKEMKIFRRLTCGLLLFAMLVPLFCAMPVSAANTTTQSHTKNKVVSVVYDNSGSMADENRWHYAKYAIQTLMALLGPNDKLIITPMNVPGSGTTNTSNNIVVDLQTENRQDALDEAMSGPLFTNNPNGTTPADSIKVAEKWLTEKEGMKTLEETTASDESNSEYFLVILTDGAFDYTGGDAVTAANMLTPFLNKYSSFQMLYLAFSQGAIDLTGSAVLKPYGDFHAYMAAEPSDIAATMQSVANRITGRYSLSADAYERDGNTVVLDLDKVDFGLRSISMMMQDSNARLQSATYNGKSLSVSQKVIIAANTAALGIKDGESAVLRQGSATDVFSGGKVVLTFDKVITDEDMRNFSVLLEPALSLNLVLSLDKDGKQRVDAATINSTMKPGEKIYVSYEVFEEGSGEKVNLNDLFGHAGAIGESVAYGGKKYGVGEPIALLEGTGEVSVTVSVMNGTYTLYDSFPIVVLKAPEYFRIKKESTTVVGGDPAVTETVFTVYDNNTAITDNTVLATYQPTVTARDENGNDLSSCLSWRTEGGKLIAKLDVTGKLFGNYILDVRVVSPDGNPRTLAEPVPYYPTTVSLETEGETSHSMTLHELISNDKGYTFVLSSDGSPMEFTNSMVSYTVKVGDTDVTAFAVANGDRLTFVPTKEALGTTGDKTGNYKVKVTVTVPVSASDKKTVTAETDLALTSTVFELVPVTESNSGTVNRFRLHKNETSVYFRVLRDGAVLPEEELSALLTAGELTVDHSKYGFFLSPLSSEETVEVLNGEAVLRVRFCSSQGAVLPFLMTSMFVFGNEREVVASYGSLSASQTVKLAPVNIFTQYVIRVLVYLYIIQLIVVLVTFKSTDRFPQGAIIEVKLDRKDNTKIQKSASVIKIIGVKDHLVLVRLIPYIGLVLQKGSIDVRGLSLVCHDKVGGKGASSGGKKGEQVRLSSKASAKVSSGSSTSNIIVTKMKGRMKSGKSLKSAITLSPDEIGQVNVEITEKGTKQNVAIPLNEGSGPVTKRGTVLLFVKKIKK